MNAHEPGSKPVDPDTPEMDEELVRKRDMPGNPLGPDHPEKPDQSTRRHPRLTTAENG